MGKGGGRGKRARNAIYGRRQFRRGKYHFCGEGKVEGGLKMASRPRYRPQDDSGTKIVREKRLSGAVVPSTYVRNAEGKDPVSMYRKTHLFKELLVFFRKAREKTGMASWPCSYY
jgi:hypothetical protein